MLWSWKDSVDIIISLMNIEHLVTTSYVQVCYVNEPGCKTTCLITCAKRRLRLACTFEQSVHFSLSTQVFYGPQAFHRRYIAGSYQYEQMHRLIYVSIDLTIGFCHLKFQISSPCVQEWGRAFQPLASSFLCSVPSLYDLVVSGTSK